MKKERSIQILQDNLEEIRKFHVKTITVFGSVARDEANKKSDIDMLVEFEPDAAVGLFKFIELEDYLGGILGCEVDLATPRSLRDGMNDEIFKDMVRAT